MSTEKIPAAIHPAVPTRLPAFVRGLNKLPRELVHKVLDDLPIEKILQIISYKIAYLDSCVTSHIRYGRKFESQADINSVVDYYILYRDMKRWTRTSLYLDFNLQTYSPLGSDFPDRLRAYLLSCIIAHAKLTAIEEKLLTPWASGPYPDLRNSDPLPLLWIRWNWIKDAKEKLNIEKAAQWTKAADLLSAFPGKITLKKPLDPDQDASRPNIAHIANRLRATAKIVLQDHKLVYDFDTCGYAVDGIILVPYDTYLWLFLEFIRICPPGSRANTTMKLEALSIDNSIQHIETQVNLEPFVYPEEITKALEVVMNGLTQVYTGSPLRMVPRIKWPDATLAGGAEKPTFLVNQTQFAGMHLCPKKRRAPYDARELEWLEAFLKVVTWMEGKIELLEAQKI